MASSQITTKQLQGITDLTLVAPIKPGFADSMDTRTCESRLRLLLKTLNTARLNSREFSLVRPFSDTAERIRVILSLRLAILEPEKKLLLAVTFDRPWEPYIRVIWRDVGTLLDVIFCNCTGYVTAFDHSFEEYAAWVRSAQSDSTFFYNAAPVTVDDVQYLRQIERQHRENPNLADADRQSTQVVAQDPEDVALATAVAHVPETVKQGLQALSVIYRLADMYVPGTADGHILLRATHELLKELRTLDTRRLLPPGSDGRIRFAAQLDWFEQPLQVRAKNAQNPRVLDWHDVQGGIYTNYNDVTHGCMLLIGLEGPDAQAKAAGRQFLASLIEQVSTEARGGGKPPAPYLNVALTLEGLRKLGLSDEELEEFPQEFRDGMEARAGMLGDLRANHPRNWALPERNWPVPRASHGPVERVQMAMVHIVVQMYVQSAPTQKDHEIVDDPAHLNPLSAKVSAFMKGRAGVRLLSVQPLRRYLDDKGQTRSHFGFVDGISQPEFGTPPRQTAWSNVVPLGELLLGQPNANSDVLPRPSWRDNGTYLVVRKLAQNVSALNARLEAAAKALPLSVPELKAKMMGRTVDGDHPLQAPEDKTRNQFDYRDDKSGGLCPFQSHVRRANPRTPAKPDQLDRPTVPRILRRGMSYGPGVEEVAEAPRGLVFMAYNASIAEQFEVIQRWVSGGNSAGVYSGQSDPFLGVPEPGDPRTFRFQHGQGADCAIHRFPLDDPNDPNAQPLVRLEWGAYLFVPSVSALRYLSTAKAQPRAGGSCPMKRGEQIIRRLQAESAKEPAHAIDLWKTALEDYNARTTGDIDALWMAVRERHGGVLRTPYGVLVGDKDLVEQVFLNTDHAYSVKEYQTRLRGSVGEIFLGLDAGSTYDRQAAATNAAIQSVDKPSAFLLSYRISKVVLSKFADGAAKLAAQKLGDLTFDIKELSDATLAALCDAWFGLPGATPRFAPGGWRWNWAEGELPLYPGHFTAPSRYLFQPHPSKVVAHYGQVHGKAIRAAMNEFVKDLRVSGSLVGLSKAIFAAFPDEKDNDLLARTLSGVLVGFLPTVDGNLRSTLNEWLEDRSFWALQDAYVDDAATDPYQKALAVIEGPLKRTMQLRPVPELVWRTAVKPHTLGNVHVAIGDKIVVGIVSATQQYRDANTPRVCPVFGGDRSERPHYPTHACPGVEMAMGVLLGMIAALMELGPLRPTPVPLTLSLTVPTTS